MFLSPVELKELLNTIPSGYKSPDDEFFAAANKELMPEFKKLGVIANHNDDENEISCSNPIAAKEDTIDCNVPGCFETFQNVIAYQTHYNSVHRYLCVSCKRSLPTPHLLDLHISENHDTYFQARVDRGDSMFACFLEECKQLLTTSQARRQHCIDVHKFPANFRFDKMGGNKKQSKTQKSKMDVDQQQPKGTVTKIKSFSFGQSTERSFNKTCTKRGDTLENMGELMDALDE